VLGTNTYVPTDEVEEEKGKFLFFFHFVDTDFNDILSLDLML